MLRITRDYTKRREAVRSAEKEEPSSTSKDVAKK